MGEHDIDKYFKDKLKGHSKEVDTDAIWSGIDFKEEKKEKPFIIWFSGLFLLGLLVLAYIIADMSSSIQETPAEAVDQSQTSESKVSVPQSALANKTALTTLVEKDNKTKIEFLYKQTSTQQAINQNGDSENISKTAYGIKVKSKALPTRLKSTLHSSGQSQPIIQDEKLINQKPGQSLSFTSKSTEYTHVTAEITKGLLSKTQIDRPQKALASPKHQLLTYLNLLDTRLTKPFSIPQRNLSEPYIVKSVISEDSHSVKNIKKQNRLSLDLYSGIYILDKAITPTTSDTENFLALKEKSESPLELTSLGVQLKYDLGSLYFKTGLEFQSLNEKFEYQQYEVLDTVPVEGVVSLLVTSDRDTLHQKGSVLEEEAMTTRWLHHNNHRLLSVPVSIGYGLEHNKWLWSMEATALVNFKHNFAGKHLSQADGSVTDQFSNLNDTIKFGYGFSTAIHYRFTQRAFIFMSPHYFQYSNSFVKSASGYNQKYRMYGVQLGMNYDL